MTDLVLEEDPKLAELVRRLVQTFDPERVYLFGSRARGEAGADSDYDLMVLVRDVGTPDYRMSQEAHSLIWDLGIAADILVWPVERFDKRVHLAASLPATVMREGATLYAA